MSQDKLEEKIKAEAGKTDSLTNCEDCGCLIHIDVYNLHKKDEICKNRWYVEHAGGII